MLNYSTELGMGFLNIGILSPVSMLWFTMQAPLNNNMSHGIVNSSGMSTTSPGTSSLEGMLVLS